MCQSLVHKVAQSKQLMAVADPDILILFESWLDELEEEVLDFLKANQDAAPRELAENLGISESGASFLLAKLTKNK
ncbi:MAG: winged helix-turn-helix transcriptional regulator [Proteobacteria bacterium]|nr:winged helix-turn-helix transcriptional regulator [Pseudomonadota bacterium]MBU1057813.1 winged helix-turn-helix transcriptional regulator [Pseudomonadota bacterium]